MNKKLKMMDKRKIYGSILGGIIFLITILSFTYAFYYWRSSNTIVTFNISDSQFYCETDIDSSVSSLSPVLDYKDGSYQTFKVNNIGGSDTTFSLSMNVSICNNDSNDDCSVFQDESFKYKLMLDPTGGSRDCHADDTNCTLVGEGSFSSIHKGMNTLISSINLPNNSKYQYYFFMYIDGDMQNPVNLQNSSMTSSLGVCDIVVFFEPNGDGASVSSTYKKVTYGNTYGDLPTPTRNDAIVSFNSNDGSSASSQTVQFNFDGWFFEQEFTNQLLSTTIVNKTTNHIVYAKWTPDGSVTLPSVTKDGYDFTGWYSDSALTNRVGGINDTYPPLKRAFNRALIFYL